MPKSNKLIHETSPYLLQHANNPVQWQAWNKEALAEAITLDKPIILSIGYAACHWCHVMEHESFEDKEVAKLMNESFICIKVDREERPDVDQIYMDAVQAMGLNGGWPLNVFLMPNQKPFYGGTYFPKHNWLEILDKVAVAFQKNKDKLSESADNFANALNVKSSDRLDFDLTHEFNFEEQLIHQAQRKLMTFIDWDNGGTLGAPKFPMPVIWEFLYTYISNFEHQDAKKALQLSLTEMAKGGIYDQIGGGFSRYSVDDEWFAPHFEKMLYDNAQLISLYANAFTIERDPLYKNVVEESLRFIQRELENGAGGIYSALDADSEGIEGKFYTWKQEEWNDALQTDADLVGRYYSVTEAGNWEEGRNILYRNTDPASFAKKENLSLEDLEKSLSKAKELLMQARAQKIRPATDDKILCGWNALYLKSLCDAFKMEGNEQYLAWAHDSYNFISNKLLVEGKLYRNYKNDTASLPAYLEDYALTIQAFIAYAEICSDESVIKTADILSQYVVDNFYDKEEALFYFTDKNAEALIARKKELFDNVIPSSNAIMAENLHWMAILMQKNDWAEISDRMVHQLKRIMANEPRYMARWLSLYCLKARGSYEVIIAGPRAASKQKTLWAAGITNSLIFCKPEASELLLFDAKVALEGKDTYYLCQRGACQQPLFQVDEVLNSLKK